MGQNQPKPAISEWKGFAQSGGLISFVLAASIILPVPLGHVVPGMATCLLALGLMEGDGVVVGLRAGAIALVWLACAGLMDLTRD